jgi:adenine-specific DNA-methyltransferase
VKYMGNKGKMLPILGDIFSLHSKNAERIADPFCGSAAVSWYLAESTDKEIISGDIQSFAVTRARAVIERTEVVNPILMLRRWFARAQAVVDSVADHFPNHLKSIEPDLTNSLLIKRVVTQSRKFCKDVLPVVFQDEEGAWPISKAYGGYYFSPVQALVFDALRQTLPSDSAKRKIALAALVEATSKAAASPGHTAQPFQPTNSSAKYIIEAWLRNPWALVESSVRDIAGRSANAKGRGIVGDFTKTISHLEAGDLVFADPPYSGVHYSRFYHVLETITRGAEFEPEGSGRYPALQDRPSSAFSKKSEACAAAGRLLESCAAKNLLLVLTFPTEGASNGLLANDFIEMGKPIFSKIQVEEVQTDFSTLGGNKKHRAARKSCGESIIAFLP